VGVVGQVFRGAVGAWCRAGHPRRGVGPSGAGGVWWGLAGVGLVGLGRSQPLYCVMIFVKSQGFWLTLEQAPSAQ
jgi:hypothetical protein